jgi:hypothetical protein
MSDSWIIMHDWKCSIPNCGFVNKGTSDNCENCGKPYEEKDGEILPDSFDKKNAIKDPKAVQRFSFGEDRNCAYCGACQPLVNKVCSICGNKVEFEKPKSSKVGQVTFSSEQEDGDDKSPLPVVIHYPQNDPKSEVSKKYNYTKIDHESDDEVLNLAEVRLKNNQERSKIMKSLQRRSDMVRVAGIVVLALATFALLLYFVLPSSKQMKIIQTSWTDTITVYQRTVEHGANWQNHHGFPAHNHILSCESRFYENVSCHPYNCRPHQENYDCNPYQCNPYSVREQTGSHQESYSCTTTCSRSKDVCHNETVCTNNGNRSSTCTSVPRCNRERETYSCPGTCQRTIPEYTMVQHWRTCQHTCTRTVYDTCYEQCPVYDNWCSYTYPVWNLSQTQVLSERNNINVRKPNFTTTSGINCTNSGNDFEQSVYLSSNGFAHDCYQETTTFSVTFQTLDRSMTRTYVPETFGSFLRFRNHQIWEVSVSPISTNPINKIR